MSRLYTSHIVESSWFPLANWLHLSPVAQLPCLTHDGLVHQQLVHDVVYILEEVEVGRSDGQGRHGGDPSVPEEVGQPAECHGMQEPSCQVEALVALTDRGVHPRVDRPRCLHVEHQVAHSVVLVAQEVCVGVDRSLVEVPIQVVGVASLLVGVDHPVQELDDAVLVADHAVSGGCEVEGHLVVTLDVHEAAVHLQQGVAERTVLQVSVKGFKAPVCHFNLVLN